MQYISVELITLLEAGFTNFSQGMNETLMKFQFFFAVFLVILHKLESIYDVCTSICNVWKKIIFYVNVLLRRSEGSSRELINCFEKGMNTPLSFTWLVASIPLSGVGMPRGRSRFWSSFLFGDLQGGMLGSALFTPLLHPRSSIRGHCASVQVSMFWVAK